VRPAIRSHVRIRVVKLVAVMLMSVESPSD
jgi:hypothetical protein